MKVLERVDIQYICQTFEYKDGRIFWRLDRPRDHFFNDLSYKQYLSRYGGKEAAVPKGNEYALVRIQGHTLLRSWIVFVLGHGRYPERSIRRLDNDKHNDRLENLYDRGDQ